jgi:hypothetical protein
MGVGAGAFGFARVYRDPIVVAVSADPGALLRLPLSKLDYASRVLSRAGRLEGVLGRLRIGNERWRNAVAVSAAHDRALPNLAAALGAMRRGQLPDDAGWVLELSDMRLRFGPKVAVRVFRGPGVEPGDAQRLTATWRDLGLSGAMLLDLTESANVLAAFEPIARFSGVVLSPDDTRDILLAAHAVRALEAVVARQRPLREISPYRTAGGLEDDALFVGRAEELRKLADRDLQNGLLVGARQMGKSSLLKAVARRLSTRPHLEVYYRVLASNDLAAELASALGQPRPTTIAEFIELVRGTEERPRVWLIDEADSFARSDLLRTFPRPAPFSWAIRALAEEGSTYFVLAGFWQLFVSAIFNANSPLRNLGELMRLGPLDYESACSLVRTPMASLGIQVEDAAVRELVQETGFRANLIVLACQGLLEGLGPRQAAIVLKDLDCVWTSYAPLRDALMYWKELPLDRAIGHAALSLSAPTTQQIDDRLSEFGIRPNASELDRALERLELAYVLLRQSSDDGPDRWACPVPLIARFERRVMSWEDHLERDADELVAAERGDGGAVERNL